MNEQTNTYRQKAVRSDVYLLMGLPFDAVTIEQAAVRLRESIKSKSRCFLSTPNVNFAITAVKDEAFYRSVAVSDLSVADGMPLVWLAKLMGVPITERVAGSDLFQYLSECETATPISVFFFGGESGIAELAHNKLNQESKGMISVGYYDPGFVSIEEMSHPDIISTINDTKPDFILVALGAKKGQQWIMANQTQLNAPVISHLGAVINFVAGHIKKAPEKWSRLGLEWLWRIKQEPALWKRYVSDAFSLLSLLLWKQLPYYFYDKRCQKRKSASQSVTLSDNTLKMSGSFFQQNLSTILDAFVEADPTARGELLIDMTEVEYVDNAFLAQLVIYAEKLKLSGARLKFSSLPKHIERLFEYSNVKQRLIDIT